MSIFINNKDTLDITVYYKEEDNKITILNAPPTSPDSNVKSLTITFRYPDFGLSQQITLSSTENTNNGPVINIFKLRNNLIYFLAYKWDAKNENGEEIELNNVNISKLKPEIASFFISNLQNKLGSSLFI